MKGGVGAMKTRWKLWVVLWTMILPVSNAVASVVAVQPFPATTSIS
jgi:hypothetical protein